jgi:hypothetical protein
MKKLIKYKYIVLITLLIILIPVTYIIYWVLTPYQAQDLAIASLKSTEDVIVSDEEYILFQPREVSQSVGIIIYPGARVEPEAYAVLANELAKQGFLTSIVPMPLNLAVLDPIRGQKVIDDNSKIKTWIVVGHSLGGSMAARFANESDQVTGLVFLAAYPENRLDLSNSNLEVGTTVGSNDGLVSEDEIEESLKQLPQNTLLQIIEGGNHAQFGDYGPQSGDNPATITYTQQREQTIKIILEIISSIKDS